MCRCGASFGSTFLFENGASVDGASVVWTYIYIYIYKGMLSKVSFCVCTDHHCKAITLLAADCSKSEECSKSCRHMSQCTSNVSAHASIQICNQGNFLRKERRKQEITCFSLVKVDVNFCNGVCPRAERYFAADPEPFQKAEKGCSF